MKNIFVAGIGTEVGKTLVSAILCEALEANYWKPIQAGNLENSDSTIVRNLVSSSSVTVYPEVYKYTTACSPHLAAKLDNRFIKITDIVLPESNKLLIVEGAGGLLVPLNQKDLLIDLITHLKSSVVLVSKNYLGSINHTLLSIEALLARDIPIVGIIFNGEANFETEEIILSISKLPLIGRINQERLVDSRVVKEYASSFIGRLNDIF